MTSDRDRSVSATGVKDNTPSTEGFAEPNYTQVPNHFLDNWLPHLTGAETKVLLYIFRRTFGFQAKRNGDWIGIRQICHGLPGKDQGTGLHLETASRAARSLVEKGLLRCHGDGNQRRFLCPIRRDPPAARTTHPPVHDPAPGPKLTSRKDVPPAGPAPTAYGKSVHEKAPPAYGKSVHEAYGKSVHERTENPYTQKKGKKAKERTSSSPVPAALRDACRVIVPAFDDDAVRTLWTACRKLAPDCTAEEVADVFETKAAQVLRGKGVRNPVGLLLAAVPKCFAGGAAYRKEPKTETTATRRERIDTDTISAALLTMNDPNESAELRELAAEAMNRYRAAAPSLVAEVENRIRKKA